MYPVQDFIGVKGEGEAAPTNSLERIPCFVENERRRCRRPASVGGPPRTPKSWLTTYDSTKPHKLFRPRRKKREKCGV